MGWGTDNRDGSRRGDRNDGKSLGTSIRRAPLDMEQRKRCLLIGGLGQGDQEGGVKRRQRYRSYQVEERE